MDEIRSVLGLPPSAPLATVHKRSRTERDAAGDDDMGGDDPHYQVFGGGDEDMAPPPPQTLAQDKTWGGRGRGRGTRGGRGRKSVGTAAERARAEHEAYVERIYPRMPPDMKPRLVRIDPDNIAPMKILATSADESLRDINFITTGDGLHEVSFGCSSHVPFVADGGGGDDQPLRPEDHPYIETVNYKSYGHRDATTAILVARGQGSAQALREFAASSSKNFCVYRGGRPFAGTPADPLFAMPDWRTMPVRGTLAVTSMRRSVEFSVLLDHALRIFDPVGPPVQFRDDARYARYSEFRVFVRFPTPAPGLRIVDALMMPPILPLQTSIAPDVDDDDLDSMGANARLLHMADGVPTAAFFDALAQIQDADAPIKWFAAIITDPKMLCTSDDDSPLAASLSRSVPLENAKLNLGGGGSGEISEFDAADGEDFAIAGYPIPTAPFDPSTAGILHTLLDTPGMKISRKACDEWMATRGDSGISALVNAGISTVAARAPPEEIKTRGSPADVALQAIAALVGLRLLHCESKPDDVTEKDDEDAAAAIRALRGVDTSSVPVLRDLSHFLFWSLLRRKIGKI